MRVWELRPGWPWWGWASWMVSQSLTRDWVAASFLPFAAMQAFGQTFGMRSLIFFNVLHIRPSDAPSFGVVLQTARLFGGELGTAGMSTWLRLREQVASQPIGLNVQTGDLLTQERL